MPAYDTMWFAPPAPVARVTVVHPETGETVADVPMLLDTGADVSLLPQVALAQLGLKAIEGRRYELVGFDGNQSTAEVVLATLSFCGRKFRGQFLATEQPWGILGRNIMNSVSILLDGPGLTWTETPRQ